MDALFCKLPGICRHSNPCFVIAGADTTSCPPSAFSVYSRRASPGKKVTTLSQQPLRLAAHISNKLDYWGQQGEH